MELIQKILRSIIVIHIKFNEAYTERYWAFKIIRLKDSV